MTVRFAYTDNDNCRVYYRSTGIFTRGGALYAFQEDEPGRFTLYRCSQDGEPTHPVRLLAGTGIEGMPDDDSITARAFRAWFPLRPAGNGTPKIQRI